MTERVIAPKPLSAVALVEDEQHPIRLELFDHHRLTEVDHEGTRYVLCHNLQRKGRDREMRLRLLHNPF